MPRTSPKIAFGLYALDIKPDSTLVCSDEQSFSKVADLKTNFVYTNPIVTYEPDYWLLDGNYKFNLTVDTNIHIGLMSLSMSNASGDFTVAPVLTITFDSVHSSDGLVLRFAQQSVDFANDIDVAYYDESNVLIRSDNYIPTEWEFSTNQIVSNFKKIIITFNSTNKPYRYLRLTGIDFGKMTYFTGADIKSATVIEEFNPISIELPINTLELNLFSNDAAFSIINPDGEYAALKNKQPLDVYEVVNNAYIYIGQFYLDNWESYSDKEISFYCIDAIGVLDKIEYMGGAWTVASLQTVGDLINTMMSNVGIPYELDSSLEAIPVVGFIPISTYREALQQIAFSINASVTCSRSGVVKIYANNLASELVKYDYLISKSDKSMEQSLSLKTLITGVEITSHSYYISAESKILFDEYLEIGTYIIKYSNPVDILDEIIGATIVNEGQNFIKINVSTPGDVFISGFEFIEIKRVVGIYNEEISGDVKKNIISISDATLVNPENISEIAQRVYDYYKMRYLQKVKLFSPNISTGNSALIDILYNKQLGGVVEKMTIDLSGGFTAQTEITGVVIE